MAVTIRVPVSGMPVLRTSITVVVMMVSVLFCCYCYNYINDCTTEKINMFIYCRMLVLYTKRMGIC